MLISQTRVPLIFLTLVATLGMLMRSAMWFETGIPYTHLLHAHSHVGFQGWLYLMLFVLSTRLFLTETQFKKGRYGLQFRITTAVLTLMLAAFLWQGYAAFSIAFSTVFQLLNYWFMIRFWKDLNTSGGHRLPVKFVKTGILFGAVSTLAPYYVGYLSAIGMKGSALYSAALYFFFHFQYNGWFLFVLIGVFYQWLNGRKNRSLTASDRRFFVILTCATPPAYAMSVIGLNMGDWVRILSYFGGVLTFITILFLPGLIRHLKSVEVSPKWPLYLLWGFVLAFWGKLVMQLISLIPDVEYYAFHNRFAVIAFLHWCFLFVLSAGLLGMTFILNYWKADLLSKTGVVVFGIGALASEFTLFAMSMGWGITTTWLWWASLPLLAGVLIMWISPARRNNQEHRTTFKT